MTIFIGSTSKDQVIKINELEQGDVFKKLNGKIEYLYYGREKTMDRFNQVKKLGPHVFAKLKNMDDETYTNRNISVILVSKAKPLSLKKKK